MQRATYVAQLAVPFTLLATVIFSYLGWREAVEARHLAAAANEQQQAFFISQNPPEIDLVTASVAMAGGQPWIFFTFKNVGGSEARSPCVTIHGDLKFKGKSVAPTNCGDDNSYKDATIDRNKTFIFYTPQSFLGLVPDRFTIWQAGDPHPPGCASSRSGLLQFDIQFYDLVGTKRSSYAQLIACGK